MSYKQWADRVARDKRATFVIYNPDEDTDVVLAKEAARYWSNAYGWTTLDMADRFDYDDVNRLSLPVGGYWTKEK